MNQEPESGNGNKNPKRHILIIIGIVVVLVILAIALPRYWSHVKNKHAREAQQAITELKSRVDSFWQTNGRMQGFTLEQAMADAKFSKKLQRNWQFVVVWKSNEIFNVELIEKLKAVSPTDYVYVAPYRIILAIATKANPIREGSKIWFDGGSGEFHGYGVDTVVEPDWGSIFPDP